MALCEFISASPKNAWNGNAPISIANLIIGWTCRGDGSTPMITQ